MNWFHHRTTQICPSYLATILRLALQSTVQCRWKRSTYMRWVYAFFCMQSTPQPISTRDTLSRGYLSPSISISEVWAALCCIVVRCAVLCRTVLCWFVLYCTVQCCIVLCCTAFCWFVLYCTSTVLYCFLLICTVLYCFVLICTVLYCAVLYCTVLYCTSTVLCCAVLLHRNPSTVLIALFIIKLHPTLCFTMSFTVIHCIL